MHVETFNKLINKAKDKKDGIYLFQGYHYAVKNSNLKAYVEDGTVYTVFGSMSVNSGTCQRYKEKETLKNLLSKL